MEWDAVYLNIRYTLIRLSYSTEQIIVNIEVAFILLLQCWQFFLQIVYGITLLRISIASVLLTAA